jgi:5-methylcytosine-specific restriction endonuclease McrA
MLSVQGQKLCSKCGHPGIFCRDRSCVDGLSAWCRECRGAKHRRWAALNPERCLANVQNYQANNRTLVTARTMAWQTENRDRHLTTRRTWAASNPEKILTHGRRYAAAHPEKLLERNARRRAALAGVPSTLTAHEWATILEVFGCACAYCLRTNLPLTQDHVIPISKGGGHTSENVAPACGPCNSRKGNRPVWTMVTLSPLIVRQA